jgi:hypothetical protein
MRRRDVDEEGKYVGTFQTYAISGQLFSRLMIPSTVLLLLLTDFESMFFLIECIHVHHPRLLCLVLFQISAALFSSINKDETALTCAIFI